MKTSFIIFFLLLSSLSFAQEAPLCDFNRIWQDAQKAEQNARYGAAVACYLSARACDDSKATQIDAAILRVFNKIDSLRTQADSMLTVVQAAQAKNEKIIDASYFYAGRFGMAVKKDGSETKYGFIDKEGNPVLGFDENKNTYIYSYAQPFDERTGFALVKKKEDDEKEYTYFIDTLKNEYRMSDAPTNDNNIVALDLREKNLDSIPTEVFQMKQLKILLLGKNNIKQIPPQMKELSNLRYLDLLDNKISRLENLENLTQLIWFSISSNQISKLEGLDNLTALPTFDISGNQISKLEGLDHLPVLQTFNISYNKISKLEALDNLKALQTLSIVNNQLNHIEGLDNLKDLKRLEIYNNQIISNEEREAFLKQHPTCIISYY